MCALILDARIILQGLHQYLGGSAMMLIHCPMYLIMADYELYNVQNNWALVAEEGIEPSIS